VLADQTYNMDEKDFAMETMNGSKRVFSRKVWEKKIIRAALQGGSREWVTILACIGADGAVLTPRLIYQSDRSAIMSSWVDNVSQGRSALFSDSDERPELHLI
jgi:hypothetical protein